MPHVDKDHPVFQALLRTVAENPADMTTIHALADFLEEENDPRGAIARRHAERDQWEQTLNPEGKRLYVKSHRDYIPLTPGDRNSSYFPHQKVRVHVYGILPGKERPVSPNRRTERSREVAAVAGQVRLAFDVRHRGYPNPTVGGEIAGYFTREEAEELMKHFHPDTAKQVLDTIREGFGTTESGPEHFARNLSDVLRGDS